MIEGTSAPADALGRVMAVQGCRAKRRSSCLLERELLEAIQLIEVEMRATRDGACLALTAGGHQAGTSAASPRCRERRCRSTFGAQAFQVGQDPVALAFVRAILEQLARGLGPDGGQPPKAANHQERPGDWMGLQSRRPHAGQLVPERIDNGRRRRHGGAERGLRLRVVRFSALKQADERRGKTAGRRAVVGDLPDELEVDLPRLEHRG
mmetsp:Transcript_107355/g.309025  ORF Transcript_107355/g.309025 Transcript_107355/m.309025 type:complete len:209 (-) Transcript_107355:1114-1740(-)